MVRTEESNCKVKTYRAAPGYNELFLMSPYPSIYPGAIIDGNTIATGQYTVFRGGTRKNINVFIDISGIKTPAAVEIPPLNSAFENVRASHMVKK